MTDGAQSPALLHHHSILVFVLYPSALTALVSGHEQQIFFPDLPTFGPQGLPSTDGVSPVGDDCTTSRCSSGFEADVPIVLVCR